MTLPSGPRAIVLVMGADFICVDVSGFLISGVKRNADDGAHNVRSEFNLSRLKKTQITIQTM
jgi:hypothetical protein